MIIAWFLGWSAERNGRRDGRNAIPLPTDPTPPPYLLYLRDAGQGRLRRLELSWRLRDKALFTAWCKRKIQQKHAEVALAMAQEAAGAATSLRDAAPKAANVRSLQRAKRALNRQHKRLNRAQERLTQAAARRQARWNIYQARLNAICHEVDEQMQRYITANVSAREDGRTPLGLLDEHRPRLVVPPVLQQLSWEEAGHA